jgi:hypothetical protein
VRRHAAFGDEPKSHSNHHSVVIGDERAAVPRKIPVMSGRRPVVKGRFEVVVNVSGAVMSTAFDAEGMHPLALMIRPRGSSPPSFARARTGADRYSGFQAFSVGSHHFVGALDADRPRRRKLLIE